jgi:3-deoxy-manno-octulosonate cytidylyltransferase (CMP-KDO synthetase)
MTETLLFFAPGLAGYPAACRRPSLGNIMSPIVLIPARMAARRLPGKPLAEIQGVPMVVWVLRRAVEAEIGPVAVACAEPEIARAVEEHGGRAVLTRPEHPSGSDRIFEALEAVDPARSHDIVVNLQGDWPTVDPDMLRAVLKPLENPAVDIATLAARITEPAERANPNVVKAAIAFAEEPGTASGGAVLSVARALYFSRANVPWDGDDPDRPLYHHIGIYAYRRDALARFVALPVSALEQRERLEQLRALEAGLRIDVALVDTVPFGIDTPADLERARAGFAGGGL